MPIHREPGWELLCDGCGEEDHGVLTREEAVQQAKANGWRRRGSRLYCPQFWSRIQRGEPTRTGR